MAAAGMLEIPPPPLPLLPPPVATNEPPHSGTYVG